MVAQNAEDFKQTKKMVTFLSYFGSPSCVVCIDEQKL